MSFMVQYPKLFSRNGAILLAVAVLVATARNAAAQSGDIYCSHLRERGLQPTAASIRAYLQQLHAYTESADKIDRLIAQLGDDDHFRREAATRELLQIPVMPRERLEKASTDHDPEIRWRARQVLELGERRAERLLYAVFTVIQRQKLPALAKPVLEVLPMAREEYLRDQGFRALAATARKSDATWLRKQLVRERPEQVAGVVMVLERLVGPEADEDFLPLLNRPNEHIQFAAARALLNHGRREGLKPLAALLSARDMTIRLQSAQALRTATGHQFGYIAYENPPERDQAAERWKTWVEKEGAVAPLTHPLADEDVHLGRILVCHFHSNRVVEYDQSGKLIWTKEVKGPADCEGTAAGHRIICSSVERAVYEFDDLGTEVWRIEQIPGEPYSVQRLHDGNTLVCCADTGHVVEYRPDKTIAWRLKLEGEPLQAQRLGNGNTLVTLQKARKVSEVRRDGTIVWELPNLQRPRSAERLPNGKTLVTEMAAPRYVEYDFKRNIVWFHTDASIVHPLHAQRLPSGNTLISAYNGVWKIDPHGRVLWMSEQKGISRVCCY